MRKMFKRFAAMGSAMVMAISVMSMGASAYNYSWSVRQLTYAPTSESCYFKQITKTNSQYTIKIKCTSVSNDISGSSVLAKISIRPASMYFTKANQVCTATATKIGINVTSSVELNCPNANYDFYYAGDFIG